MAHWRLAKSLIKLRDQINQASPSRSKVADGSIGDQSHSARASDHNPNAQGVVTAVDITHDPVNGCDGRTLSRAVTADPRVKYTIFNGMIWKAKTGKWEPYRGPNRHDHHVHISVKADRYDNVEPWSLAINSVPVKPTRPVLKLGDRGPDVARLQSRLAIDADGVFGFGTQKAVMQFQEKHGLEVDGKVGEKTWQKLG